MNVVALYAEKNEHIVTAEELDSAITIALSEPNRTRRVIARRFAKELALRRQRQLTDRENEARTQLRICINQYDDLIRADEREHYL